MLEFFFDEPAKLSWAMTGPFKDHVGPFARHLIDQGYARATGRAQLFVVRALGIWFATSGLSMGSLTEEALDGFLAWRREQGKLHRGNALAARRFLAHLRARGVVPVKTRLADPSPQEKLEERYREYLEKERGLVPATYLGYRRWIRMFLEERFGEDALEVGCLAAGDIFEFLLRHAHVGSPGGAKLMVTALRSFLRFLFQRGEIETDLSASVPTVAHWRLAGVPRYLGDDEVEELLKSCDLSTATGRRDRAILLLLARLALRAGEIVALRLEDMHWRDGTITVRGKGQYHDRLPLPREVGNAIAAYLRRDRPSCRSRRVFLRRRAPLRGFKGPSTVSTIVRRAIERAGLEPSEKGAHLLRRTLATSMLGRGATLAEIGQILRHRSPNSTEIYAKVDIEGLRSLARPWPVAGGGR